MIASKTLNPEDYNVLSNEVNIVNTYMNSSLRNIARYEHPHRLWEYAMVLSIIFHNKCKRVMEIGGGFSPLQPILEDSGVSVLEVDPGLTVDGLCKVSRAINKVITCVPRHFPSEYNTRDLFDAVISTSVIEHVVSDEEFFIGLLNNVKPGGFVILTTDFHPLGTQIVAGHIRSYNKQSLENLIEVGQQFGFSLYGGTYNYDFFEPNVNGCTFATLIMEKE